MPEMWRWIGDLTRIGYARRQPRKPIDLRARPGARRPPRRNDAGAARRALPGTAVVRTRAGRRGRRAPRDPARGDGAGPERSRPDGRRNAAAQARGTHGSRGAGAACSAMMRLTERMRLRGVLDRRPRDASAIATALTARCQPEATLARVLKLAPALGITRLSTVTGLDRLGVPVAVACRPNSRSLAVFQGKGLTLGRGEGLGLHGGTRGFPMPRPSPDRCASPARASCARPRARGRAGPPAPVQRRRVGRGASPSCGSKPFRSRPASRSGSRSSSSARTSPHRSRPPACISRRRPTGSPPATTRWRQFSTACTRPSNATRSRSGSAAAGTGGAARPWRRP